MHVLENISVLYTCPPGGSQDHVDPITDAVLAWKDGAIEWVGPRSELPDRFAAAELENADGCMVIPGLIDCHTHLAFGGWRADEFEKRLRGVDYLEIAREGGGIRKSMRQTRMATDESLLSHCEWAVRSMMQLGVTTVEAKTGYGLSEESELRLLRIYRELDSRLPVGTVSTFLGAHVVPPEFEHDREAYVALICDRLIPVIARDDLAEFCDVFVEEGAFTAAEARTILTTGQHHGMGARLHVDQLHDGGGAALAAELHAVSADHLEYTSDEGISAMADAGVVAVCLPLASLYLKQPSMTGRRFIDAGVPVAVATDFNPGTAPSCDLPLAMMLSCTMSGLTPAEALKAATCYAARALGRSSKIGSLEVGKQADFALIEAPDVNHWLYQFQPNACRGTFIAGKRVIHT